MPNLVNGGNWQFRSNLLYNSSTIPITNRLQCIHHFVIAELPSLCLLVSPGGDYMLRIEDWRPAVVYISCCRKFVWWSITFLLVGGYVRQSIPNRCHLLSSRRERGWTPATNWKLGGLAVSYLINVMASHRRGKRLTHFEVVNRWCLDFYVAEALNAFRDDEYTRFTHIRDHLQSK